MPADYRKNRGWWFGAELNRQKGELVLRQGHPDTAEEPYRKELRLAEAERQDLELRAAISLAELRRDQARLAEALDLLAPIFGWFTEGFDTPDLKEATALLDELRVRQHDEKTRITAHMGMFEVKGSDLGVEEQFSGRWLGSKV